MSANDFETRLKGFQRTFHGKKSRAERDAWYYEHFFPQYGPVFAARELRGAPPGFVKPRYLISLLGFSWQPVALLAQWIRPERMLVIATGESAKRGVGTMKVLDLLSYTVPVTSGRLEHVIVDSGDEVAIYKAVKDTIQEWGVEPFDVAIDATGGKKSMSVAAGLAAFFKGSPLLYVDYAEFDDLPVPGTEFPRLLTDPVAVLGDAKRRQFLDAFNRCGFAVASVLLAELRGHVGDARLIDGLERLTKAYLDWTAFRFADATKTLGNLATSSHSGGLDADTLSRVRDQVAFLETLLAAIDVLTRKRRGSLDEGLPAVLIHLAAAERAYSLGKDEMGRFSECLMLAYSTIERYVTLRLWTAHGIDAKCAQYGGLSDVEATLALFNDLGAKLYGRAHYVPRTELPQQIAYMLGIQLLAALEPEVFSDIKLGKLKAIADDRNRCEFEHGLVAAPVDGRQALDAIDLARKLVINGGLDRDSIDRTLETLRFPTLSEF